MATFYEEMRETASELIAEFGTDGTIIRSVKSGSLNDPISTPAEHPCKIAVLEYESRDKDGSNIRQTDKLIYVSTEGLNIELAKSDKIKQGTQVYEVVAVAPLAPAGVTVYWEAQGRI